MARRPRPSARRPAMDSVSGVSVKRTRWVISLSTVLLLGAVCVFIAVLHAGSVLLMAAVIAWFACAIVIARHVMRRSAYQAELERNRRMLERRAIADDVHDLIGHELSLIAMRAGLVELRTEGEASRLAAEVRSGAEAAVHTLHESIMLVNPTSGTQPVPEEPERIIETARQAGAQIDSHGSLDGVATATRLLVSRIIREGLTNASRHAPTSPITVRMGVAEKGVTVDVITDHPGQPAPRRDARQGLPSLRRRVEAHGGTLTVTRTESSHRLSVRLDLDPTDVDTDASHDAGPGPWRSILVSIVATVLAVMGLGMGGYFWLANGTIIEPEQQAALHTGMPADEAKRYLPNRQAVFSLTRAPAHPRGWTCRVYTDGNFPFAFATLEVCDDGTVVTRVTDLTREPLR